MWEETYRFITPHLQVVDQYDFRIDVFFPEDGKDGITYRQLSHYDWPDGRTGDIDFEAHYENGQVVFDVDLIAGRMWKIDDNTIYLTFGFPNQPGVKVSEPLPYGDLSADWFRMLNDLPMDRPIPEDKILKLVGQ